MSNENIKYQILNNPAFVEQQLEQFVTYYQLKHTIRWAKDRDADMAESVAEHVYGMQIIAEYFLPLHEDLVAERVRSLIMWHDMSEALVSDIISYRKTEADRDREKAAEFKLFTNAGPHLQEKLEALFVEYHAQESREAQFVKALDKIEIPFHLYFIINTKHTEAFDLGRSIEDYRAYRQPYLEAFPLLQKFDAVLERHINDSQYFPSSTHDTIV